MNAKTEMADYEARAEAAEVLEETGRAVAPGVTTDRLDVVCHEACLRHGGYPSPLNYHGYPKSLCTSVNEVICHGIPDSRALIEGERYSHILDLAETDAGHILSLAAAILALGIVYWLISDRDQAARAVD